MSVFFQPLCCLLKAGISFGRDLYVCKIQSINQSQSQSENEHPFSWGANDRLLEMKDMQKSIGMIEERNLRMQSK